MSLDTLVDELRRRGESDLKEVIEHQRAELATIAQARAVRIAELREAGAKATEAELARERAQRLAAAHLAARRALYEAREARLDRGLTETRALLAGLTGNAEYAGILRRMIASSTARLGRGARISGRAEDATLLARLAGKSFDATPRPILGGIVAESDDGRRRLDLSFDELLRQRADEVRGLLA